MTKWKNTILPRWNNEFNKDRKNWLRADVRRNNQKLANKYWSEMNQSDFFTKKILPRLPKETVGNPYKFNQYKDISPQTVQHLYHIFKIKTEANIEPYKDFDTIIEFGGGYGNLCRLIHNLGFKGKYILVDFEDQLKKQKWFLEESGIDITNMLFLNMDQLNDIKDILEETKSMLVGTYSISEMPIADRKKIEPLYPILNYIFIIYKAKDFDSVDNEKYFNALDKKLNDTFLMSVFDDLHYSKSRYLTAMRDL